MLCDYHLVFTMSGNIAQRVAQIHQYSPDFSLISVNSKNSIRCVMG